MSHCTTAAERYWRQPPENQNHSRKEKRQKPKPSSGDCVNRRAEYFFTLQEQNHRAPNRWQHRLNRERPMCTERNKSLLESADGSMATVATRREKKRCLSKTDKNRLDSDRPSTGKAFTLRTSTSGVNA